MKSPSEGDKNEEATSGKEKSVKNKIGGYAAANTFWSKTSSKQRFIILGSIITIVIILISQIALSFGKNLVTRAYDPLGINVVPIHEELLDKGGLSNVNIENNWFGIEVLSLRSEVYKKTGNISSLQIRTFASGVEIRNALAKACGTSPNSFVRGSIGQDLTSNGTWTGMRKSDKMYIKCYYEAGGDGKGYILIMTSPKPYN